MEEAIQRLTNVVSKKAIKPIKVKTFDSDFTINFNNEVNLDPNLDYKIGVVWFDTTNSIYNITNENNQFKYYNGTTWKTFGIPNGGYEVSQINSRVKELIKANSDDETSINIDIDLPTLRSSITLTNNYQVDFTIANSLRTRLGFDSVIVNTQGVNYSNNVIQITNINTINLECNLASGFFVNDKSSNILFSHPIPVPIGYTFRIVPKHILWAPLNAKSFKSISFRVTDDDSRLLNFNGYIIQYLVEIRQV